MKSKVIIKDLVDMNYVKNQLLGEYEIYRLYEDSDTKEIDLDYLVYAYHTIMKAILTEVWINRDNPKFISNKTTSAVWNKNYLSQGDLVKNRHARMEFDHDFKYIEDIRGTIEDVLKVKQETIVTGVNPANKLLNLKYKPFEKGSLTNESIMKEVVNNDNIIVNNVTVTINELLFAQDIIDIEFSVTEKDVNLGIIFGKEFLNYLLQVIIG